MRQPIYLFVAGQGFVKNFDLTGPVLEFTQYVTQAQDFETESQARHIIRANSLQPAQCFLMQESR